jgi:hypothetical protein
VDEIINQTIDKLNSMKLRAMEQEYRRQVELPANATLPFDERLAMIVEAEWLAKANKPITEILAGSKPARALCKC